VRALSCCGIHSPTPSRKPLTIYWQALGSSHLDASSHSVMYDLGMGTGKVLIQAFLQFRNLRYVYGIELSLGRYM
jgi:precorrin-6B methylase 2